MAEVLTKPDSSWSEVPAVPFGKPILKEVMHHGFAVVDMTTPLARVALGGVTGREVLADVYRESNTFFARDDLMDFTRVQDLPFCYGGYRGPEVAKLQVGEQPDLNRSFLKQGSYEIPNAHKIEPYIKALGGFTLLAAAVTQQFMQELARHYEHETLLKFSKASVTQVNYYDIKATEVGKPQQHWHQDSSWLTVIAADKPGLYGLDPRVQRRLGHVREFDTVHYPHEEYDKHGVPIIFKPGHVLVMGGSILSAATGGEIKPFYHSPLNEYDKRSAVMYFVSPDLEQEILPFVSNKFNDGVDLRYMTATQPSTFGLGKYFVDGSREYYQELARQHTSNPLAWINARRI